MGISDWSVNAYLVYFLVSGTLSLLGGLYLSIIGRQHPLDTRILLNGIWDVATASGLLVLFRTKTIENAWAVIIATGVLSFAGRGIVFLIAKSRGTIKPVQTEESKRQ